MRDNDLLDSAWSVEPLVENAKEWSRNTIPELDKCFGEEENFKNNTDEIEKIIDTNIEKELNKEIDDILNAPIHNTELMNDEILEKKLENLSFEGLHIKKNKKVEAISKNENESTYLNHEDLKIYIKETASLFDESIKKLGEKIEFLEKNLVKNSVLIVNEIDDNLRNKNFLMERKIEDVGDKLLSILENKINASSTNVINSIANSLNFLENKIIIIEEKINNVLSLNDKIDQFASLLNFKLNDIALKIEKNCSITMNDELKNAIDALEE